MASLRDAKVIIKNAQALELFMRVSPVMPLFLERFEFDKNISSRLLFSHEVPKSEDPRAAVACEFHMQRLKPFLSIDPKQEPENDGLYYDINLADPRLKDKLLDLTVQLIKAERDKDSTYTLSHFPTMQNAPNGYKGLLDSDQLYDKLSGALPEKINRKYLEDLLPEIDHLAAKFRNTKLPERYR